ncbi:MAG: hypothetical protein KGM44_07570, partial [bacterium]|nr:hypothetical protein [bacterium]
ATPPNAVVVAPWLDATPLGYAAYVERSMGGRVIVSAWPKEVAAEIPAWREHHPVYVAMRGVPDLGRLKLHRTSRSYGPIDVYEVAP